MCCALSVCLLVVMVVVVVVVGEGEGTTWARMLRIPLLICVYVHALQELINKIDKDGSGEIEYEEFKTLLS
jgi:hypothetical protein